MTFWRVFCVAFVLSHARAHYTKCIECPPFWTRYEDNCYRFFGPGKTWDVAEQHCQEFFTRYGQGHLASIHSDGECDFLLGMWRSSIITTEGRKGSRMWLGFCDLDNEGTFVWTDGTAFDYEECWVVGEPNDAVGHEDCGDFYRDPEGNEGMNDDRCVIPLPYICKIHNED